MEIALYPHPISGWLRPFMKAFLPANLMLCVCLALNLSAGTPTPNDKEETKLGLTLSTEFIGSSDTELEGGNLEYRYVNFYQSNWALVQIIPVGEASSLSLILGYNLAHRQITEPTDFEDDESWPEFKRTHPYWDNIPLPKQLQSLVGSVEYFHPLNEKWAFSGSLSRGSYVTDQGLLSDGWGTAASVMAMYAWSHDLNLAFGATYDSLSHDYRFVPVIGVDWRISKKWSLAIGFPATALTYIVTPNFRMSLEAAGSGGTYYVKDDPAPGLAPSSLADSLLESTDVRLGFRIDWKINSTFSISASSGFVLYREFKYIDRDFKLKSANISSFSAFSGNIAF
jgi:hypothetical protein